MKPIQGASPFVALNLRFVRWVLPLAPNVKCFEALLLASPCVADCGVSFNMEGVTILPMEHMMHDVVLCVAILTNGGESVALESESTVIILEVDGRAGTLHYRRRSGG